MDIVCHVVAECPSLFQERNILWDYILNTLDVRRSVVLSCLDDDQFTDFVCGVHWTGLDNMDNDTVHDFLGSILVIIYEHFYHCFTENYEWFN